MWWARSAFLLAALINANNNTYSVINVGSRVPLTVGKNSSQCSDTAWKIESHPVGLPCVKVVTGSTFGDTGYLSVWVETSSGTTQEADDEPYSYGKTLERCYWEDIVSVKAKGRYTWKGSISYSHDGGATYTAMTCTDCTGPSNSAARVVLHTSVDTGADTRCGGYQCTFVKPYLHCVKVTTTIAGYLTLSVDVGAGQVQEASGNQVVNSVVLDKCYESEIVSVTAKGTHSNGWVGAVTHSSNGGQTYAAMECEDCTGPRKTAVPIYFDGDSCCGQSEAGTYCINKATCTMVKRPLYCVKIVTGGGGANDGPLDAWVDTGSGPVQEASGNQAKNSIVVDKCSENDIVSVKVKGPTNNGWAGSVTYSSDGGQTYASMNCTGACTGPQSGTAGIVADGDDDAIEMAKTWCFNGEVCTLTKRPNNLNCVLIVTGGTAGNDGPMEVWVDTGSGPEKQASGNHRLKLVVVDMCSEKEILSVMVKAESLNGWLGAITHSYDGGHTYTAMECSDCTSSQNSTAKLVVDGNDDGADDETWCHNMALCKIVKAETTTTTTTTVYTLQAIYGGELPYLGHNGLALGLQVNATVGVKWKVKRVAQIDGSWTCTLQAVVQFDSGESYLSSDDSGFQMVSSADTANETWMIEGFC